MDDEIYGVRSVWIKRFEALSQEAARLREKIVSPQVPDGKKARCRWRLEDIQNRLLPRLQKKLS